MERSIAFRLPVPGWPRALVVTDYGLRTGRLVLDGATVAEAASAEALARGVSGLIPDSGRLITLRSTEDADVEVLVDGVEAMREDRLRVPPSRSAWAHAGIALLGSLLGLLASYLYVLRAEASGDPWAMKMALHMAAWHLLLALTLFPASVWGQRLGIRAVQVTSAVFFLIHLGIALANAGATVPVAEGPWIAVLNAASGLAFLAAVLYGQRAHADMDPLRACHVWLPATEWSSEPLSRNTADPGQAECGALN